MAHSLLRTCRGCATDFPIPKSSVRTRFCSRDCWYAWNRRPLADRFWEKVDKNGPVMRPELGECWVWTGSGTPKGYGHVWDVERGHHVYAHRVSWELHHGAIPDGLFVLHHCDFPSCIRPAHLWLGSCTDNLRDMVSKGRNVVHARLTPDEVRQIRRQYAAGGVFQRVLAEQYQVAQVTIQRAVTGASWKGLI